MLANMNATRQSIIVVVLCVLLFASPIRCFADNVEQQLDELLQLDLTELANLKVVLPTRLSERQFDAPSAIYVITQEDIRRSGLTRIPEILRMVPGLHVGKLDNNTWSVSSRSDLLRLSHTMLVLMDGRTLYDPLFAGVYWDVQDTFIQDIERIEIIRGPGGPLWGANAVDGIINIVTKSSHDTIGGVAYGGYGKNERKYEAAFRYGGHPTDDIDARLYVKRFKTDQGEYLAADKSTNNGYFTPGDPAHDDGHQTQAGFRVDWQLPSDSSLNLQGDIYDAKFNNVRTAQPRENTVNASGHNIITKWSQNKPGYRLDFQFIYDHTERTDLVFEERRDIVDLDFQHALTIASHLLTWGLGYRYNSDETMKAANGIFALDPENSTDDIYSVFFQDRIALSDNRWFLTLGSKFEHNDFTGFEVQPTIRLLWKATEENTAWASVTRAVHTPSRAALDGKLIFCEPPETPGCSLTIGDPDTKSESVIASEAGYRTQLSRKTLVDVSVFNNRYFDTPEDGGNIKTYGLEMFSKLIITPLWQIELSYAYHRGTSKSDGIEGENRLIPKNSANLRSLWNINRAWEADVFVYYTDAEKSTTLNIEDYTRVDLRMGWNPIPDVKTSLSITNLFDDKHAELVDLQRVNTAVGRGIFLSVSYTFN
jgi:iron complex outermembrane receptor protein